MIVIVLLSIGPFPHVMCEFTTECKVGWWQSVISHF